MKIVLVVMLMLVVSMSTVAACPKGICDGLLGYYPNETHHSELVPDEDFINTGIPVSTSPFAIYTEFNSDIVNGHYIIGTSAIYCDTHALMQEDGRLQFRYIDWSTPLVTDAAYNDGEWHKLLYMADGSNMDVYIDGEFIGTVARGDNNRNNGNIIIGARNNDGTMSSGFRGYIRGTAVFNRELTSSEIETLMGESTCSNGVMDGDEEGIDCGGDCEPCNEWIYEKPININYQESLQNFTVQLSVDTQELISNNRMNPDCSDIRFKDENGNSLSYWIEGPCDSEDTIIHVKIPTITADKIIYMLYGNVNALSESSGLNTFIFFDDFEDGISDSWELGTSQFTPIPSENDGKLNFNGVGSGGLFWWGWAYAHTSNYVYSSEDFRIVTSVDLAATGWSEYWLGIRATDTQAFVEGVHYDPRFLQSSIETLESVDLNHGRDGPNDPISSIPLGHDDFGVHRLEITYDGTNKLAKSYYDDEYYGERYLGWEDVPLSVYHGVNTRSSGDTINVGYEYTFITNYAPGEHSCEVSDEEYICESGECVCFSNCEVEPTCDDGIQNGDETGVDCGGSCPESCSSLVAYYPFDNGVADESGNDHDGTNNGASETTRCGGAYDFEKDESDYLTVPYSEDFIFPTDGELTLSAWIYPESTEYGNYKEIITFGGVYDGYTLKIDNNVPPSNSRFQFKMTPPNGGAVHFVSTDYIEQYIGKWTHVAVTATRDGNVATVRIYLDGQLNSEETKTVADGAIGTGLGLQIGWLNSANYFDGGIDNVRVYNSALSSSDIQAIYDEELCCVDNDNDGYTDCDGDINDSDPGCYPGAEEVCDGKDNDYDGQIDGISAPCGVEECASERICTDGVWSNCQSEGQDCGICAVCDAEGFPEFDAEQTMDCVYNNLNEIATCNHDENPFSWEYAAPFLSECIGVNECSEGSQEVTSECSIELCEATCESDADCFASDCDENNGCYDGTYRDYAPVTNFCSECQCSLNSCSDYEVIITDADGDQFDTECDEDCNDADASIYPGAAELCDRKDNDCDGVIPADEQDADEDGMTPCEGDCNDADTSIFDGAAELCDRKDNDCDGILPLDEQDTDGDDMTGCEGDCDDSDASIFDGAPELCDGKDNDCDGIIDEGYPDYDGDGLADCIDTDDDNDGVNDADDLCGLTPLPDEVPTDELRPNNHADVDGDGVFETNTGSKTNPVIEDSQYTLVDSFGCSCAQILFCKPGNNKGEEKHGCSQGTMNVFTGMQGWAVDCFDNGLVEGESKSIVENTDQSGWADVLDGDNDNDGLSDSEEIDEGRQFDDAEEDGKPDWWCAKHPNKC